MRHKLGVALVWRVALALLMALALAGCAAAPADQELPGAGSPTPEGAVESFLEQLNAALADSDLASADTRRKWAEVLAGYFAPAERADQRVAMSQMLAGFVDSSLRPTFGSKVQLEITFSRIEIISRSGGQVLVGVVDGTVTLRWLDDTNEVVRTRSSDLMTLIGQESGGLPVLRVGPSWYLTEG